MTSRSPRLPLPRGTGLEVPVDMGRAGGYLNRRLLLIEHRVNTVEHLQRIPVDRGVEVDIRDYDGDIRLVHDPLLSGERLDDYLAAYRHAFIILNVKCDGLEKRILQLVQKQRVENFFFPDAANPSLVALVHKLSFVIV